MVANEGIHRYDISDKVWRVLEPLLPGREGGWGRVADDNRRFINAVFWILRTGAPWRDLPPEFGGWKNTHRRFTRWRDKGIWKSIFERLIKQFGLPEELEWVMIDATFIKCHMSACGAKGGNQEIAKSKGGSTQKYIWPWMRMVIPESSFLQMVSQLTAQKLSNLLIK